MNVQPKSRFDDHETWLQKQNGRSRAQKLYPDLGCCEVGGCEDRAKDRHHADGDTDNNDRENVRFLCRRHHMEADGRLAVLAANAQEANRAKVAKLAAMTPAERAKVCARDPVFSDETMFDALRQCAAVGRLSVKRYDRWRSASDPSSSAIRRRFRGWVAAVREAGLEPHGVQFGDGRGGRWGGHPTHRK